MTQQTVRVILNPKMGVKRMPREQTVLVTAFEPFGGRATNRSQLVLEHIARAAASPRGIRPNAKIVTKTLPVSFDKLEKALVRALSCKPDAVILLGESSQGEKLDLEQVAVNRIDAQIPDNEGVQPRSQSVVAEGPDAYFSTVLPKPALAAVRRAGVEARLSSDAGTYACNAVYYLTLHRLHRGEKDAPPVIFVHVPVRARIISLRDATKGVLALLRHILDEMAPKAKRGGDRIGSADLQASRKA